MAKSSLKPRLAALGGVALLAGGALFRRRRQQARLGSAAPAPSAAPEGTAAAPAPGAHAAPVANVDVAGPPENTSTAVPAPEAETASHEGQVADVLDDTGGIDEDAEEQAAAAEAANIGGRAPEYFADDGSGDDEDEAFRAVDEGGGGESEGEELAEEDLIENAEADFDREPDAEKQIDEVIEAQDDPFSGETGVPGAERIDDLDAEQAEQALSQEDDAVRESTGGTSAKDKSAAVWRTDDPLDQPTVESPKVDPDAA